MQLLGLNPGEEVVPTLSTDGHWPCAGHLQLSISVSMPR